ncbi:salivary glue protein Sgs-8 [Drosophila yakuba]|uniref:Salivary gland secretion 8 n=1 Tax=Drosophila yakuba TaxID=7245 RepID=B4PF51_DROYA|nr:salivary glue protein Sgs-8 [Drosophila yakuba]EDW94133.1 salivary gland secretion 8 [Drosophila yakuba]
MKLIVVAIIACILLIGFSDLASGSDTCACQICGPGGKKCPGDCPERVPLCKELIGILSAIEKNVRVCVCGEKTWLL